MLFNLLNYLTNRTIYKVLQNNDMTELVSDQRTKTQKLFSDHLWWKKAYNKAMFSTFAPKRT